MKKHIISAVLLMGLCSFLHAQPAVDVAESTLKVAALSEEVFYYGFAAGDQLLFSFEEVNGKELKEIEIIALPGSSRFMDYKTRKVETKTFSVTQTGIYKFRFSNGAITGRICRFSIKRVPGSEQTRNFNTTVFWETKYDTTYTMVDERYLIRSDTAAVTVVDQTAKVSSTNALNGNSNKTVVDIILPEGTISWSYYIGVGREGREAYEAAKSKALNGAAMVAARIPGYGTMAALALYGANYFSKVQGEDNVKYYFISNWDNVLAFEAGNTFYQYKQGDVINDASQMKSPLIGKTYLGLSNDNIMEPIDVLVKVTAITVKQQWGTRQVQKMHVTSSQQPYLKN
jgi:hypothetical protein